ncbi:MAG TPA: RagB/SusD family nutrient uptake outer membrane protein [Balneolaceae bacterium]|nr:RagB/SusD family nutrient uptake outer membrane protein [Balneolaceae bacterium]
MNFKALLYKVTLFAALLVVSGCEEHLTRPPLDQMTDETYWTNEENVRTFSWGFYPGFFTGYGSGFTWGAYFSGQSLNDDFAPTNPPQFTENVPTSGGGWGFANVRKANIFIDRVQGVDMAPEAVEHWTGVGRFFRGLQYHLLVRSFGDVPWYDEVLEEDDERLYKPRDPRTVVMDNVLSDFKYAAEHVRESDGEDGLTVNRYVVLAYMSRAFLFEGTFLKYHDIDQQKAEEYLKEAKWAADQIIQSGNYQVSDNYREMFNSLSLAGNPEMILYRKYEIGVLTHALNSYNNREPQTGVSKNAIESYLASDGLPISISPAYQGDRSIEDVMANRDPRLRETIVPELRLNGVVSNYSTSGYATHKFLNEEIKDLPEGSSNLNPTDAPVIRYGEVLMNYAEAAAELGTLTQEDLDKSINQLRARGEGVVPPLQVIGGQPAVNGAVYDDPKRDPDVSPLLWEIRRERRTELMMEGFRLNDLRRWKKLDYADTVENPDINRGAWVDRNDYPDLQADVTLDGEGEQGYIVPSTQQQSQRRLYDERVYLNPIPINQITLYRDNGAELSQNPGW